MSTTRVGKMQSDEEVEEAPEQAKTEEETPEPESEDFTPPLDPNEEVWEGGPTYAQIEQWKQQYGDIYVTSITPEKHVVWRTLTRFEYRRLVKNLEQQLSTGQVGQAEANMNNEESIAELCILFPKYVRTEAVGEMAGIASSISQQVMEASAFVSLDVRQL